jgi:osmotically inducible lipoprotein OsmB
MRNLIVATMAAALLAGCGTAQGDRGLSGAGIGAGIGIVGGPPGMVVGAAAGAVVGLVTPPSKINLGRPAWQK